MNPFPNDIRHIYYNKVCSSHCLPFTQAFYYQFLLISTTLSLLCGSIYYWWGGSLLIVFTTNRGVTAQLPFPEKFCFLASGFCQLFRLPFPSIISSPCSPPCQACECSIVRQLEHMPRLIDDLLRNALTTSRCYWHPNLWAILLSIASDVCTSVPMLRSFNASSFSSLGGVGHMSRVGSPHHTLARRSTSDVNTSRKETSSSLLSKAVGQ